MSENINVLFVADIVGEPGLQIAEKLLPSLKKKYNADLCIANGENVTDGKGINDADLARLLNMGVEIITSGNHIWDTFKSVNVLKRETRLLRPANYPEGNPGVGYTAYVNKKGIKFGVINLQGRTFMLPIDNPFVTATKVISKLRMETQFIIVDFHAEATAEKITMGWYLDGKVSAIIGTHTHVQTADERILTKGTAYITDAGMTGAIDSVIGMNKDVALHRFLYSTNQKYQLATENLHFCGVLITMNQNTGLANKIERINLP